CARDRQDSRDASGTLICHVPRRVCSVSLSRRSQAIHGPSQRRECRRIQMRYCAREFDMVFCVSREKKRVHAIEVCEQPRGGASFFRRRKCFAKRLRFVPCGAQFRVCVKRGAKMLGLTCISISGDCFFVLSAAACGWALSLPASFRVEGDLVRITGTFPRHFVDFKDFIIRGGSSCFTCNRRHTFCGRRPRGDGSRTRTLRTRPAREWSRLRYGL